MARPNPLRVLMATPLPTANQQRRLPYRPNIREVRRVYQLLNKYIFSNQLSCPPISIGLCRDSFGECTAFRTKTRKGTYCKIHIKDKWWSVQWMVNTLAHEMAHQYQWDIASLKREKRGLGPIMSHGPSFFQHKERMASFGITLKYSHSLESWFEHQDLRLT